MDADGDTHKHVLRTLGNTTIDTEEVGSFQRLETKASTVSGSGRSLSR